MATVAVPTLTRLSIAWVLGIQPRRKTDLLAHACHDAQVVQAFIDVHVRCGHQESSAVVNSTRPIFTKTEVIF
jgi:hypothetical protein